MADMKISGLPAAGALEGSELLELVQAGASKRASVAEVVERAAVGRHTIWLPATAWLPRLANGPAANRTETATNKIVLATLDFDPAIIEYAQTTVRMPKSWDRGPIGAEVRWTAGGGSGNVIWVLQALAVGDGTALDGTFGAPRPVTDLFTGANAEHRTAETAGIEPAGNTASGDRLILQIHRNASAAGDTLTTDAKLLGVTLFYGTAAATDD